MKRWIKWIGIILLIPVALVLLLAVLLYVPAFQNFVIREVTHYASKTTGMQIGFDRVRLSFPLDLTLEGVQLIEPPADTLLLLKQLTLSVKPLPLLRKEVVIDAIDLRDVRANTGAFIEGMELKGGIGKLYATSNGIDLKKEEAVLNKIELSDAALTLFLNDTTSKKDTASTPVRWKLKLDEVAFDRIAFAMQIPADSLRLSTYVDQARLTDGQADLADSRYTAGRFTLGGSTLNYDVNSLPPVSGLDPSHIALSELETEIESIVYQGKEMQANIRSFSVKDRSGLEIRSLEGDIKSDSTEIRVPDLNLKTPYSTVKLQALVPWKALSERPEGTIQAKLDASLGKQDLLMASGVLPEDFKKAYPDKPLTLVAEADGNFSSLHLRRFNGDWPGILELRASGAVEAVTDSIRRSGEIKLEARTGNLDFILGLLPAAQREQFRIPEGMRLEGEATVANQAYQAQLTLREGLGRVDVKGRYNQQKAAYEATLKIDSLQPNHFMPHDSLLWITAALEAEGQGTDLYAASTWGKVEGKIYNIRYGLSSVSDVTIEASLKNHAAKARVASQYPFAKMNLSLDATIRREEIEGMLDADVENFDLYAFHWMEKPFSTSFQLFAEGKSNLKENNSLDVSLGNWTLTSDGQAFRPKLLTLRARTNTDTTQVSLHSGDLGVILTGNAGLNPLIGQLTKISKDVDLQLRRDSTVDLNALRPLYPDVRLDVSAGQDNPIFNYLESRYYIEFDTLSLHAYTSPATGFRLNAGVYGLARDTMLVDTIRALMWQDSLGLKYRADVVKNRYRQQAPFSAGVDGNLRYDYADARVYFKDGQGKLGVLLGVRARKIPGGARFELFPDDPILAFRKFRLNEDNYIVFKGMKDIAANVRLTGEKNASLWIHSQAEGGRMDDVHLELNQFDLEAISNAFSYIPPMKGMLSADLQYAPSDSAFMVVADVHVDTLYYEHERVGEVMMNAVYLPVNQTSHQVDVHFFRDRSEILSGTALYATGKPDRITGSVDMIHLPLDIVNPFIPEDMAKLSGDLDGHVDVGGASTAPEVEGYLLLDSSSVFVGAVGSSFRFDQKKIEIKDNLITFDQYAIYASGKNPFVIDGTIDFHDFSRMLADLKLSADNLELLNVKRNNESLVYGKVYVNLNSTVKGPLDALTMRGNLEVLGNTNATYVLKDSPLTVQDRMSDMVTFVSFADTVQRRKPQKPPLPLGGMDLLVTITVDPAVQLNVDLTPDHSSYVNLEGGGDLSFQYTPQGEMVLNGMYTLTGGTVKYSLPVIPLKDFTIQNGSYVQWTGNPMNPTLNLTATERVRTSVSIDGQSPRLVNFDVGIVLKQTLENLSLQFTLNAPEDMAIENQLSAMSAEERAKQAVSMLVTGMYLASDGSGGKVNMNMGSALNSLLQSEINNIAGSALKSVDITFGMDSYDENGTEGGGSRTDYNISFAKRFYNDRIRVVIGGRISTGENINNGQAQPFIDNITVEYRLDTSGSRYIKLFHDTNYESLLEGEITETGAGIVLRKKMMHLRELFNFKKKKVKPVNEEEKK